MRLPTHRLVPPRLGGACLTAFALAWVLPATAGSPPALREALGRLFPAPASVVKDTLFLTEAQVQDAEDEAGSSLPSRIVTRYVARKTDADEAAIAGYVYVDTHIVRTVSETLLIVVTPNAEVSRVEVLEFDEPQEYQPSDRWFAQFEGRELDPELRLKRGIRMLTGATLSSRSATEAVRRALAVHHLQAPTRPGGEEP